MEFSSLAFPLAIPTLLLFPAFSTVARCFVAYNVSSSARNDAIVIDAAMHADGEKLQFLYGKVGNLSASTAPDGTRFVRLPLAPHQFVIVE